MPALVTHHLSLPVTFFILACPPNSTVNSCGTNTLCQQTNPGIYNCSCKSGYSGGYNCTDINECTTGQHQCSNNADCTNTKGSYTCQCKFGYFGNGTTCDGKKPKVALKINFKLPLFISSLCICMSMKQATL